MKDGSTEQSLQVLRDYQKQEPTLMAYANDNRRVSAARKQALKYTGEYMFHHFGENYHTISLRDEKASPCKDFLLLEKENAFLFRFSLENQPILSS